MAYEVHFAASVGLLDALVGRYAHDVVLLIITGLCATRAARHRSERLAWWLITAAMLSWTLGEIYYTTVLYSARSVPVPSPADIGYLGVYPLAFAGLMLLMRERTGHVSPTIWVDGVIAVLVVGALACAVVFEAVLHTVGGRPISIATNLSYPLGDMLLLLVVVTAYALRGWRPDRSSMFLGAGIMCFWAADSIYLVATAQSSAYTESGPLNVIAWTGFILVALAAWQPSRSAPTRQDLGSITVPICFALVGLSLLLYATVHHVNVLAVALAGAALVGVIVRLVITFRVNVAMLRSSRRDAMSDALTSLSNRRQLMSDLEQRFAGAAERDPFYLVLFDLDGFKLYNDHFGNPAGDELLQRVSADFAHAIAPHGDSYRIGGDEFCALVDVREGRLESVLGVACATLAETGDGFAVRASCGAVCVPTEAADASEALRIADNRLYQDKDERRGPRDHTHSALLQAVRERHPDLHQHLSEVAALSRAVAVQMGLGARDLAEVVRAAELHDVGKIAIPDTVLDKPGPLNEREWELMERHTVLGERILAAAPALGPIAEIVRASHERYDGGGYPDGIAGERIPLPARIIFVCDSFNSMTSERPYAGRRTAREALSEIRRCAGSQFDPQVVVALGIVLDEGRAPWAGVSPQQGASGGRAEDLTAHRAQYAGRRRRALPV
jgi:diguanylate cyclase (GGDEF)-like protein